MELSHEWRSDHFPWTNFPQENSITEELCRSESCDNRRVQVVEVYSRAGMPTMPAADDIIWLRKHIRPRYQ
ncbi:hypothetical protein Mp_2g14350 [Marchantia polymorpha subsp. ruderalis]|uniref:Uncharacterized protein n=1 Tax=Marchantia polymorpha TaxID=3197 RepID=A0A2R6X1P2_MARPO|nr:hypothetical protein MARPO_0042s0062 [Marchantia polymorpha]BBN02324.1 hypothetical protein Mp_2g14350 [Marchantia polymorpha subsp. ruderalis]|eukprot:PTQ40023.1 hypothetical protein MARPO_0042s0062 [Marchantia polymorpha]